MSKSGKKSYWVSLWSEGRNTQLSKFGFIKWDILGLKTLKYIFDCCTLIQENRGISFGERMSGWDDIDPLQNRAGHFFDQHGNKHYVELNDPAVLELANAQKTDGIFQFDTDLAKSILSHKVRNFEDLMLLNAMGHPGPMASIPEAVANRDDVSGSWRGKMNATILEILDGTHGVIVYQEQLQAIWQRLAGFTAPEAQEARKAVAKKWTHKLKPIRDKWITGASLSLGASQAEDWWPKMETFGRYAFNRSHAVSYCLVAHKCLWLKAHFAPEFWAAVMNDCKPDKLVRYMGVARVEGWQPTEITKLGRCPKEETKSVTFGTLNIEHLTTNFTVTGNTINQGMIGIKGIGDAASQVFEGRGVFKDIDEFIIQKGGRDKTVMERFIKLGAFRALPGHENAKALWNYYMFKYGSGSPPLDDKEKQILAAKLGIEEKKLTLSQWKKSVRQQLLDIEGWTTKAIEDERTRQINEYKTAFPKRTKIPEKFHNWMPKPAESRAKIMALFPADYALKDVLEFEENYLGYYLHSPIDVYSTKGDCTIAKAKTVALKGGKPKLEVLIKKKTEFARTKAGKDYARVFVTDGMQEALVLIWNSELAIQKESKPGAGDFPTLEKGVGVSMDVDFDEQRGTFSLRRGAIINKLLDKNWRDIK
jgi:DNA polymerase III alpha subunit